MASDTERYASPELDALRVSARDAQLTADWLQSLTAEAQRYAVMLTRQVQRAKSAIREQDA